METNQNFPDLSDLTLVSISYNSSEVMPEHISSLSFEGIPESKRPRWIVVDNASTDETVDLLEQKFTFLEIIKNPDNRGFGTAANQGIQAASTRFIVILNPDTNLNAAALAQLISTLKNNDKAAISGPNVEEKATTGEEEVEWIIGAVMMLDTEKLKHIGYFDERFFLYFEETDLCTRTIKAGYKIIHNQAAHIPHVGGGSSIRTPETEYFLSWHYGRSYTIIAEKHPEKYLSKRAYLWKQIRRWFVAVITFNRKREIRARSKITAITGKQLHPSH